MTITSKYDYKVDVVVVLLLLAFEHKKACGMNDAFHSVTRFSGCDIQFIWNVIECFNGV